MEHDPLAGYSSKQSVQRVRPAYSSDSLLNPHVGTASFQRFEGDALDPGTSWDDSRGPTDFSSRPASIERRYYPATTIAYCRWLWSVIEPERGKIRWDIFDGALAAAAARGQTLQIRVQPYIAVERDDTPQWYWDMGGSVSEVESKKFGHRMPCINDPRYIEHWGQLVSALGSRYDGHPNLESVDLVYGGCCGETGGNANQNTAEHFVEIYRRAFSRTQLISMVGTHGCKYASALNPPIGWRADCIGDLRQVGAAGVPSGHAWNHMYDAYPREVFENQVSESWRRAPVVLETCWTVPHWHREGWDIDWLLEQALHYHPSVFMPKSVFIPDAWRDKFVEFGKRLGYRFFMQQMVLPIGVVPGANANVQAVIENKGVAPIYRPYAFALRFSQGSRHEVVRFSNDIRHWMPGLNWFSEDVRVPEFLEAGRAQVSCSIVGPDGTPKVGFAMGQRGEDGWHCLTEVIVAREGERT